MADHEQHPRLKDRVSDDFAASWNTGHEIDFILIGEVHRRFMEKTEDSRAAAALTLAWAMLEAGSRGGPNG